VDDGNVFVRAFSFIGFGGVFLMISPKLRDTVNAGMLSATKEMELYSPYSYIAGGVLVLLTLVISMYRGAQPQ
jgi:hypothetical protein